MAKTYSDWLAERDLGQQSVEGLSGLNTIKDEQQLSHAKVQQASQTLFKPLGTAYNQPGSTWSRYDKEITNPLQFETPGGLHSGRAEAQSGLMKFTNALVGGVIGGLFTAIEDVFIIGDVESHWNNINSVEQREDNVVAEWARKMKKSVHGAMPIYEEAGQGVIDSFLKWNTLRGVVDSVVGFGLPGGIVGKSVQLGMKGLRAARLAGYSQGVLNMAHAGTSGYLMNLGETGVMNMELAENATNAEIQHRAQQILVQKYGDMPIYAELAMEEAAKSVENDEDFKRKIGEQQRDFAKRNKLMIFSDGLGIHGLFKLTGQHRNIVQKAGLRAGIQRGFTSMGKLSSDNILVQNFKEMAEEMYQVGIQSEGEFQVRKQTDNLTLEDELQKDKSSFKRILSYGTSEQAWVEGLMGFFSGGAQRVFMDAASSALAGDVFGTKKRAANAALRAQQEAFDAKLQNDMAEILYVNMEKAVAEQNGDKATADYLNEQFFHNKAQSAFNLGTTEMLERHLQDVVNLSAAEAKAKGYAPDYKAQAEKRLEQLKKLEKTFVYNNTKYGPKQGPIVSGLQGEIDNVYTLGQALKKDLSQKLLQLQDELSKALGEEIVISELSDLTSLTDLLKQRGLSNTLVNSVINNQAVSEYFKTVQRITDTTNKLNTLRQDLAEAQQGKNFEKRVEDKLKKSIIATLNEFTSYRPNYEGAPKPHFYFYQLNEDGSDVVTDQDGEPILDESTAYTIVKENDKFYLKEVAPNGTLSNPNNEISEVPFSAWLSFMASSNLGQVFGQMRSAATQTPPKETPKSVTPTDEEYNELAEVIVEKELENEIEDLTKTAEKAAAKANRKAKKEKIATELKAAITALNQSKSDRIANKIAELEKLTADQFTELRNLAEMDYFVDYPFLEDGVNFDPPFRLVQDWFFGTRGNILNGRNDAPITDNPGILRWFEFITKYTTKLGQIRGKLIAITTEEIDSIPGNPGEGFKKINPATNTYYPQYYIYATDAKGNYYHRGADGKYYTQPNINPNEVVRTSATFAYYTYAEAMALPSPPVLDTTQSEYEETQKAYLQFIDTYSNGTLFHFDGVKGSVFNGKEYSTQKVNLNKAANGHYDSMFDIQVAKNTTLRFFIGSQPFLFNVKKGALIIFNKLTGRAVGATAPVLDLDQKNSVIGVLKAWINSSIKNGTEFERASMDKSMIAALQGLTTWSKTGLNRDRKPYHTNPELSFHLEMGTTKAESDSNMNIVIGGVSMPMVVVRGGKLVYNEDITAALDTFLSKTKHNFNRTLLQDTTASFTLFDENGDVKTTYKNYETYLASRVLTIDYTPEVKTKEVPNSQAPSGKESFELPKILNEYFTIPFTPPPANVNPNSGPSPQNPKTPTPPVTPVVPKPTPNSTVKQTPPAAPVTTQTPDNSINLYKYLQANLGKAGAQEATFYATPIPITVGTLPFTVQLYFIIDDGVRIRWNISGNSETNNAILNAQFDHKVHPHVADLRVALVEKIQELHRIGYTTIEGRNYDANMPTQNVLDALAKFALNTLQDKLIIEQQQDIEQKAAGKANKADEVNDSKLTEKEREAVQTKANTALRNRNKFNKRLRRRSLRLSSKPLEDFAKVLAWAQRTFPEINFNIDQTLMLEGAYGTFLANLVRIAPDAPRGTVYHEAFHVVFNLYLDAHTRKQLLEAISVVPEFKSYVDNAKNDNPDLANDDVLQEALSDVFADFMDNTLDVSITKLTLWEELKRLFKDLLNYIGYAQTVRTNKEHMATIFKTLNKVRNTKEFRTNKRNIKSRIQTSKRNKIVGLDYSQTVEALNGIHFYTMDALRLQSGSFLNLFDSSPEARVAIANSLEHAKNQISKKILFVEDLLREGEAQLNQEIDDAVRADLETEYTINTELYNTLSSLLLNWDKPNGAVSTYLDYLKQFAINLTEDSLEDALNYDESQSTKDLYAPKDTINQKAYMAGAIRLLVSSIAKVDEKGLWYNNLGFPVMLPFGQVYNLLVNKLSTLDGTTSPEELKTLLSELTSIEPGIAQLYEPLNYTETISFAEFAGRDGYIRPALLPFNQVENAEEAWFSDVNLLTQFIQTFAKYNYAYIIGYANAGSLNVTLIDATESAIKRRLESNWKSLKAQLSKHPDFKKFFTVENGIVYHNPEGLKSLTAYIQNDTSVGLMQKYLNALGLSLSSSTAKHISQNVALFVKLQNLYNDTIEKLVTAQPKDLDTFIFPHELTTFLIEQEIKYGENIYENSHFNFEGSRVFNNNLHSYMSVTISKMEKVFRGETTVDAALPHLSQANNPKTSLLQQWLEQGPKAERTIKFGVMEGIGLANELNGIPYEKMSPVDRILVKYRMMQQGKYEMIRPADASQNRYIDIKYPFLQEIALTKTLVNGVSPYQSQVIDLFVGYLRDELMQVAAINTDYSHFKKNHNNEERFILAPMLKGITIDWENKENLGPTDFADSILTEANLSKIRENFDNMLAAEVDSRREFLIDNGVVIKVSDDRYYIGDLFTTKNVGSEANLKSLNRELTVLTLNDWISTIEQYNIFFGGAAHYKNLTHSIKRIKGTVGTKKLTLVGNWLNNFINTRIIKINNLPHLYDSNGQPLVRTVVVSDPMVISSTALYYAETLDKYTDTYINLKEKISKQFELDGSIQAIIDNEEAHDALVVELSKEANELLSGPYFDMTESDGFGVLSLDAYRTLLIRNGSWSTAAEKLYQWEVQEYNNVPVNQRKYVDLNTGMESKLTYGSWGNHVFNSIKPQYFGPMANVKGFVPTFYKMSVVPILPSMTKEFPALKATMDKMLAGNVDILAFASANKGAATKLENGELNNLYNKDLGITESDWFAQDTFSEYWGIQLETGFKQHRDVASGTQQAKQLIGGIYERGKIADKFENKEQAASLVDSYIKANKKRLQLGAKILKEKLGLWFDARENKYVIQDISDFVDTLTQDALEKASSEATFIGLELLRQGRASIDALPNRKSIEMMLMGLARKNMISMKRNGKASYQVPSTLFDKSGMRAKWSNGKLKSTDLKATIATNQNGVRIITAMEVYLPAHMKGKVTEGKLLNNMVGYRIPTQYLSSIETLTVKGFLPESAGDIIVLPSEIVAKAGSDFDIDKLYIYLPNTFQIKGKEIYIHPTNWATQFEQNKNEIFFDKILKYLEDNDVVPKFELKKLVNGLLTVPTSEYKAKLDALFPIFEGTNFEKVAIYNLLLDFLPELITAKTEFELKAVENESLELQKQLLEMPERATELTAPIQTNVLQAVATYINDLTDNPFGYDVDVPTSTILSENFKSKVAHSYIESKIGIGPSALMGTFHILAQIYDFKIPGTIPLEHNSEVDANGNKFITLGNFTTADRQFAIADLLNQMISGGVDVVNKPWAVDLGINKHTLGPYLALLLMGVNPYVAANFINQPLIKEFHAFKDKFRSIANQLVDDTDTTYLKALEAFEQAHGIMDKKAAQKYTAPEELSSSMLINNLKNNDTLNGANDIYFAWKQLSDISSQITEAILAVNYDTKGGGNTIVTLEEKIALTEQVLTQTPIRNLHKALSQGFLSPYLNNLIDNSNMYRPLFATMNDDTFGGPTGVLRRFIRWANKAAKGRGIDSEKLLNAFKEQYLSSILLSTPLTNGQSIAQLSESFMKGPNSLAHAIVELKNSGDWENNILLKYIDPIISANPNDYHYIKPNFGSLVAEEFNALTLEGWVELFNIPFQNSSIGEYLMYQGLMQSGQSYSPMSFIQLAPPVQYLELVNSLLETHSSNVDPHFISKYFISFFASNLGNTAITPINSRRGARAFPINSLKLYKPEYRTPSNATKEQQKEKNAEIVSHKRYGINVYLPTAKIAYKVGNQPYHHFVRNPANINENLSVPITSFADNRAQLLYGTPIMDTILAAAPHAELIDLLTDSIEPVTTLLFKSLRSQEKEVSLDALPDTEVGEVELNELQDKVDRINANLGLTGDNKLSLEAFQQLPLADKENLEQCFG